MERIRSGGRPDSASTAPRLIGPKEPVLFVEEIEHVMQLSELLLSSEALGLLVAPRLLLAPSQLHLLLLRTARILLKPCLLLEHMP